MKLETYSTYIISHNPNKSYMWKYYMSNYMTSSMKLILLNIFIYTIVLCLNFDTSDLWRKDALFKDFLFLYVQSYKKLVASILLIIYRLYHTKSRTVYIVLYHPPHIYELLVLRKKIVFNYFVYIL